jgi:hypothetical protein
MPARATGSLRRQPALAIGLALLGILLCGATVVGGALLGAVAFTDTDRDDVAPAVVENVARIRLPATAYDLRSYLDGFQDRRIFVRFKMPPSELAAFERSLSCVLGPPSATSSTQHAGPKPDWFTEDKLARSCQVSKPGFHQTVTVHLGAAPDLVVQVAVFEN